MNAKLLLSVLMALALLVVGFPTAAFAGTPDTEVEIEGTIEATYLKMDGTGWIKVDGMKVIIGTDTDIDGMLVAGAEVRIHGDVLKVMADEIEVRDEEEDLEVRERGGTEVEVEGTITMLHLVEGYEFIKVDGIIILIGEADIDGELTEGAGVRVRGEILKLCANKIAVTD